MPVELLYLWLLPLAAFGLYWGYRSWRKGRNGEASAVWEPRLRRWRRVVAAPVAVDAVVEDAPVVARDEAVIGEEMPAHFTMTDLRLPITSLLLGGLVLIMMGQAVLGKMPASLPIYLVMLLGLAAFLLGTQTIARQAPPARLIPLAWRLCRALDIRAWQIILLILAPCYALMASWAAGPAIRTPLPFVTWAAWLLAIGMAIAGSLKWGREPRYQISRFDLLFTVGLLVAAYLLRGTGTAQIPTTLSGDEGSVGLSAVQFLNGNANSPFSVGWFSFPSLYFAFQSVGIAIWGHATEALRIPSALVGSLTVVALYWLVRALFDRPTAILAAAYLLASHYHIHFSRIGLNNVYDGLFAVVAYAGIWHGWKTGRRASFVLGGIALGLGQYFYVAIRVLPLLLLMWAAAAYLTQRQRFRERFPDLALSAIVALIIYLPLGLFFLAYPQEFAAPMNRVTIFQGWLDQEVLLTGMSASRIVFSQMLKAAQGFTHLPLRLLYDPGVPLLLGSAGALFLLGVFIALWNISLRSLFLLLPLLSVVFLSGFSQDPPASQRYVAAIPVVAILVALPLGMLWRWLCTLWPEYGRPIVVILLMMMTWIMWTDVHYYFFEAYKTYILGGLNTEAATRIAAYLQSEENPAQDVYFFGFPRMGYASLSTIPFLNPDMHGIDVATPLREPPDWPLEHDTIFIFLPERVQELDEVRASYPDGQYRVFYRPQRPLEPLFMSYELPISGP